MKQSITLAIATMLLLTASDVLAQDAGTGAPPSADCNRVFAAKAKADKKLSSEHLARDLNLPLETVNACLLQLRRVTPQPTPAGAQ